MSNAPWDRIDRRRVALGVLGALCMPGAAVAQAQAITVYKSPTCGCCRGWVAHLVRAGFQPTVVETDDLLPVKRRLGVPDALAACHTAAVGPYFVEGHVPPDDIKRLLRERPKAKGIAVPGMPVGSPGMESPSGARQPFETILVTDGGQSVYARHG